MPALVATTSPRALERRYRPARRSPLRTVVTALGVGLGLGVAVTAIPELLLGWLVPGAIFGAMGFGLIQLARILRINRLWGHGYSDGMAYLAANRLDEAAATFDRLCEKSRASPLVHSLCVQYRAVVEIHRGDFDRAAAMLRAVIDGGWTQGRRSAMGHHHPIVLCQLALTEALAGRLDPAQALLDEARALLSEPRRPSLLLLEAIVGARRERWNEVIEAIDRQWPQAEGQISPSNMRTLRLIEAYCLERRAPGPYRAQPTDPDTSRALGSARPFHPGEFDYLVVKWPEFGEFLLAHGFVQKA